MFDTDKRHMANRDEFAARIAYGCKNNEENDITDGLAYYRYSNPTQAKHGLYTASICVVAQGAKEVQFAGERLRYDPANYLLVSLDVPVVSQVVHATPEKPYLCLRLDLDPNMISSVIAAGRLPSERKEVSVKSMAVSTLDVDLLDAFVRLLRLFDHAGDYGMISPMVIREIICRVLKSEQGARLRQMAAGSGHSQRIAKAVQILREKYNEPTNIERLAHDLGMSVSSFHQHFKTATAMSPLQFQKALRLNEAKNLLLTENLDAIEAAVRVGYDDASQFNREYKRMFGEPPMRDVGRCKQPAKAV